MTQRVTGHVRLVERKRGNVFYLKYRGPDGHQVQKMLGPAWTERSRPPVGYYTRRTAEEALQAILTDARRGTLDVPRRGGRTFGDACAEWLRYVETERSIAPSTLIGYRSVTDVLLAEFGENVALEKLTTESIDVYRARLLAEGKLSARTIQKRLIQLHGILKRAKRLKWISANPAEDVERVRVRRSGDFNVLTPIEVEAVARSAMDAMYAALFVVAAFTGLRLGELRALRWGDVDFATHTVFVRYSRTQGGLGRPKSKRVRSVPLIDRAAAELDALSRRELFVGPDDLVFCSPLGMPLDEGDMRDGFYDALRAAGLGRMRTKLEPIVFHDLRHTFGTLAVQAWPLHDVQAYMGHADIQTTMIYVHHVPKGRAADELGAVIDRAMGAMSPTVSRTAENGAQLDAPGGSSGAVDELTAAA